MGDPLTYSKGHAVNRADYIAALRRERAVYVRQQHMDRVADVDRELANIGEPVLVEAAAMVAPETATLPKPRRKATK